MSPLLALPAVLSQFQAFKTVFPTWLTDVSVASFVGWITGTFLQIVLVGVLLVSQKVETEMAEARQAEVLRRIADELDLSTEGGLTTLERRILEALSPSSPSEGDR